MISEYAKLEWELHQDWGKALSYFEQAVRATPEDRYNFRDTVYSVLLFHMPISDSGIWKESSALVIHLTVSFLIQSSSCSERIVG